MRNEEWIENARMIIDSARAIVPADRSLDRVRRVRFDGPGYEPAAVAKAGELGLFLMRVPEDAGGLGLGMRETCELMRVLGGGLVPEPVASTIMAGALLGGRFHDTAAGGEALVVTAWQDRPGALDWKGGVEGGRLSGTKIAVPGADGADMFTVLTGDGVAVVPRDTVGLTIETAVTLDGGRIGVLHMKDVEAELVPCPVAHQVIEDAILAHSAFLLGLSERAFEITMDYLKVREQFGRPIGSFQALQHRATEMKIHIELLRAAISATARRFDTGAPAAIRARDADRCKLRAAETAMLVAREAVQMHGAMGITDEADIGLYVRKAMTEANLFGAPRAVRARMAEVLKEDAA